MQDPQTSEPPQPSRIVPQFLPCAAQVVGVHAATDGRDALDRLEFGLRPDVILLDLMMPVLNGFDVLNALQARSDWKAIPVVVVSANRGYEAEDLPGATSILRKPVNLDRLIAAVEQAVAA